MKLFFIAFPFLVLANDDKPNLRGVRGLQDEKLSASSHTSTSDNGLLVTFDSQTQPLVVSSAELGNIVANSIDYAATSPDTHYSAPKSSKPAKCAVRSSDGFEPRSQTNNCASQQAPKTTMEMSKDVLYDPRHAIAKHIPIGLVRVQIQCDSPGSDLNIEAWYNHKPMGEEEKRHLSTWHVPDCPEREWAENLFEPTNAPSARTLRDANPKCYKPTEGESCEPYRAAACAIQRTAVESGEGELHSELSHRVAVYSECVSAKLPWVEGCDSTHDSLSVLEGASEDDTKVPLNLVTDDKSANECKQFITEQLCLAGGYSGKCPDGQECGPAEYCKSVAAGAHAGQPLLNFDMVHYERGNGIGNTNSNGQLVPANCIDPNATWITIQFSESSSSPPPNSSLVFGCPAANFEGCSAEQAKQCEADGWFPFSSWQGWITTTPIYSVAAGACQYWSQVLDLRALSEASMWGNQAGQLPYEVESAQSSGDKNLGYNNPQACVPNKREDGTIDPIQPCINLSPDDCHFSSKTSFDPKTGHFHRNFDYGQLQPFWPYFSDHADWRKMLPVCFGCGHEGCSSGLSNDDGRGTNENVNTDTQCYAPDYQDPGCSIFGKDGAISTCPLWYKNSYNRSPLQRMSNASGESVVRDQGSCGSCWAFASATANSHRMCVTDCQDNGRCAYDNIITGESWQQPWQASVQSILSCNDKRQGCNGGWFDSADEVFMDFGVMKEKSFPCEQAAAKDSSDGSWTGNANLKASCDDWYHYTCKTGNCRSTVNAADGSTSCTGGNPTLGATWNPDDNCQNQWGAACPYSWDYWQYPASAGWAQHTGIYNLKRVKVHNWYNVIASNPEADMKAELVTNGPFSVAFGVYTDFPWNGCSAVDQDHVYTLGSSATYRGGHGVVIVAYGWAYNKCNDDSASTCNTASGCTKGWMKYWTIQNSWGRGWGNGGYFRIRRGTDEARIESWGATATTVSVNCNESNEYYGGKITEPRTWWKKFTKAAAHDVSSFQALLKELESIQAKYPEAHLPTQEAKEAPESEMQPRERPSAKCKASSWSGTEASNGGFAKFS